MSDPAVPVPPPEPKRGWFIILACVTLVGLIIFTTVMVVSSFRIPQLKERAASERFGGGRR